MKKFTTKITEGFDMNDLKIHRHFISDIKDLIKNNIELTEVLKKNNGLSHENSDVFGDGEYLLSISIIKKPIPFQERGFNESNSSDSKSWWYDIDGNLDLLRGYIHFLDNNKDINDYDLIRDYFIVLHNFLIIERNFYPDVVEANKEINKLLNLKPLNNISEVVSLFHKLYDNHSIIRSNIETFDSIDPIKKYLSNRPEVYKKLIKK